MNHNKKRRMMKSEMRKEEVISGFTLLEVLVAAGIFMIIVVSILSLAQIEANAIVALWNDSYNDTALADAERTLEQKSCDDIPYLEERMEIAIGRERVEVFIEREAEETVAGRIV